MIRVLLRKANIQPLPLPCKYSKFAICSVPANNLRESHQELGRTPAIKDPRIAHYLRRHASFLGKIILSNQQEIADRIFRETGQKISQPNN